MTGNPIAQEETPVAEGHEGSRQAPRHGQRRRIARQQRTGFATAARLEQHHAVGGLGSERQAPARPGRRLEHVGLAAPRVGHLEQEDPTHLGSEIDEGDARRGPARAQELVALAAPEGL